MKKKIRNAYQTQNAAAPHEISSEESRGKNKEERAKEERGSVIKTERTEWPAVSFSLSLSLAPSFTFARMHKSAEEKTRGGGRGKAKKKRKKKSRWPPWNDWIPARPLYRGRIVGDAGSEKYKRGVPRRRRNRKG